MSGVESQPSPPESAPRGGSARTVNPGLRMFFNRMVLMTRLGLYKRLVGRYVDQRGFRGAVNLRFGETDSAVWHCLFTDTGFRFCKGPHAQPLGTVQLSQDLFLQLLAGRTSYYTAEMTGRIRVEGDGHSAWVVSTIVTQCHAQARQKGFIGWVARWFLMATLKRSKTGYELKL